MIISYQLIVQLPGSTPKVVGLVALDMSKMDRKDIYGKTICNIPQFAKAIVRAGMDDVFHRRNVSSAKLSILIAYTL